MADFRFDGDDLRLFQRAIKGFDAELAKRLRKDLRDVVETHIIPTARSNAGWSSRIPQAIRSQVTAKAVGVRVASRQAPHGRAFEGLQRGLRSHDWFRHPVFGNREVWVNQRTRPYLAPAVEQNTAAAVRAAEQAIDAAARAAGFR